MKPRKRVCFIVSSSLTAQVFLSNHIQKIAEIADVYLVGDFGSNDFANLNNLNIKAYHSIQIKRKINLVQDVIAIYKLCKYFHKMNFTIIHSVTPKAGLISSISGWLVRVDTRIHVFTGQIWHTKQGVLKYLLKNLDKLIVMLSTSILVDGNSQKEYLIKNKILKGDKDYVLGAGSINGVNTKRFAPNPLMKSTLRKELGIAQEKTVFLYLGRLNHDKGIVDLVKAFKDLMLRNKECFLLIVGFDEASIVPFIEVELEKEDFLFYGPTNDPIKFYQASDVFCLPSYREGFGTSVIEASSCGLPVLCSDTYGLEDAFLADITGFKHSVGNVTQISELMNKLSVSEDLRSEMGIKGRDYIIKNFSEDKVTAEWLMFYYNILYPISST